MFWDFSQKGVQSSLPVQQVSNRRGARPRAAELRVQLRLADGQTHCLGHKIAPVPIGSTYGAPEHRTHTSHAKQSLRVQQARCATPQNRDEPRFVNAKMIYQPMQLSGSAANSARAHAPTMSSPRAAALVASVVCICIHAIDHRQQL